MPTVRPDAITAPHPSRFDPARPDFATAMAAHQRAVAAGQPGYLDPSTGLFVMTAANLVERGWCCDRGCRHCPYVGAAEPPHASDDSPEEPR